MVAAAKRKRSPADRQAHWRRVGAFIRARREELGLDQKDIATPLGYKRIASVSNIERGVEGVPFKRIYQWADLLRLPRDSFYRLVVGETTDLEPPSEPADLGQRARELLHAFNGLPERYQDRLLENAKEFEILARFEQRKAKR